MVIPDKPHWVTKSECAGQVVTPFEQVPPGTFILQEGKLQVLTSQIPFWKVREYEKKIFPETILKPLDNPGDDEVDTISTMKPSHVPTLSSS